MKNDVLMGRLDTLWALLEEEGYYTKANTVTLVKDYIEKLERAFDLYEKERARFRHAKPELTGAFFLTGGYGEKDENLLPKYVTICPAYGAGWEQVYEKTDKTITYEGS